MLGSSLDLMIKIEIKEEPTKLWNLFGSHFILTLEIPLRFSPMPNMIITAILKDFNMIMGGLQTIL